MYLYKVQRKGFSEKRTENIFTPGYSNSSRWFSPKTAFKLETGIKDLAQLGAFGEKAPSLLSSPPPLVGLALSGLIGLVMRPKPWKHYYSVPLQWLHISLIERCCYRTTSSPTFKPLAAWAASYSSRYRVRLKFPLPPTALRSPKDRQKKADCARPPSQCCQVLRACTMCFVS